MSLPERLITRMEDKENAPPATGSARHASPQPGLRHRPLGRAATFAEPSMLLNRRRSSMFSETLSDARKSLRSSTDDLLFPKVSSSHHQDVGETSPWHSLPLGLALLPALGGIFFKDGSAFITDVTLLALAAIFMNWALRMPWYDPHLSPQESDADLHREWYHAAQTLAPAEAALPLSFTSIEEEAEDLDQPQLSPAPSRPRSPQDRAKVTTDSATLNAQQALRMHELVAFMCCFIFPLLAAWLLHGIRAQLSRPSEGLVSNYNLTIFLLVAEVRPLSHLIKMIQRRTLFLQRSVNVEVLQDHGKLDRIKVDDMMTRIEELEAHVADGIASKDNSAGESSDVVVAKASSQATSELRKSIQPEIDALGRAMRRYEKRSTISAVQQEARMQEIETRVKDVVVLAAAVQRHADKQTRNYIFILTNWLCALVVVPLEYFKKILMLPHRALSSALALPKRYLGLLAGSKRPREAKTARRAPKPQSQDREKKTRSSN
jgi:hypothetical protein